MNMRKVTYEEYLRFAATRGEVVIEDSVIKLEPVEIKRLTPLPEELTDVNTTVWSFPKRGSWATHRGNYRGNWPPQIPRTLMLMYTKPGDLVLDPMVGGGTTCIEAKLLGRNCIGVDISYDAVMLTLHNLYHLEEYLKKLADSPPADAEEDPYMSINNALNSNVEIYHGDARKLDKIEDESIDLIATHPPYYNIIRYGGGERVEGDLSRARSLEEYLEWMRNTAQEMYRVLKPGGHLGILVGDTRVHTHYVPISHHILRILLETGFILREEVVKIQHKMKTTREKWRRIGKRSFLLIYHEKLYILRKPTSKSDMKKHRLSSGLA